MQIIHPNISLLFIISISVIRKNILPEIGRFILGNSLIRTVLLEIDYINMKQYVNEFPMNLQWLNVSKMQKLNEVHSKVSNGSASFSC